MLNKLIIILLFAFGFVLCKPSATTKRKLAETVKMQYTKLKIGINTVTLPQVKNKKNATRYRNIAVDIFMPVSRKKANGIVLMLPGWNFPRNDWYKKTNIFKMAKKYKFILILPEMSKSIYASQYFNETTRKVFQQPALSWIKNTFLPLMQSKYGLLRPGDYNYIMGLSTGARGVALVSLSNPFLFKAGVALSGDYDQSKLPRDYLMTAVYGNFNLNKKRWQEVDNIIHLIKYWHMPIYIGHGKNDKVTPHNQSQLLYQALRNERREVDVIFNEPIAGHDYKYWSSEIKPSFDFFTKHH